MTVTNITDILEADSNQTWSKFLERMLANEPHWSHVIIFCIYVIIFFGSLIGNSVICIVIYYDKSMHTATNFYLFNLAVSDLIVTFAILLEVNLHVYDTYPFGWLACKIHLFYVIVLMNNGISIVTALSIERYLAIWYPWMFKTKRVFRRVMKVIVCLWIYALLVTTPEVFTFQLMKTSEGKNFCFLHPSHYAKYLNIIMSIVTFIIPLSVIIFAYSMIALKVNKVETASNAENVFNHPDNRSKLNKLVVVLTLSFVVCWLPLFIMRIVVVTTDTKNPMVVDSFCRTLYRIVACNSWFSIILNPLVFSLMSTKFRKSFKNLWDTKVRRKYRVCCTDVKKERNLSNRFTSTVPCCPQTQIEGSHHTVTSAA